MGQKKDVLVPRQGSAEDRLVNTFTFASGSSAEFIMEFSNQSAVVHILCPRWQKPSPICHIAALPHPHVPGRTATYGGSAEKRAVLGWDAQAPDQLHNPCHTWQGRVPAKDCYGLDKDSAELHFTSSSFK